MARKHWTDDELIAKLYELGPDDGHLLECDECNARWRQLLARRGELRLQVPLDEAELARQRSWVWNTLQEARPRRWVPYALAGGALAALVLTFSLTLPRPASQPVTPDQGPALSDSELLGEVYSLVNHPEPAALEPVRALFEEEP